jgi:hypothetical protein
LSLSGSSFLSDFLTTISFGSFACPMSASRCKSSISWDLIKDTKHFSSHCWFTFQKIHHWWQEITFSDAFHCSPFISCSHPVYRGRPPDGKCADQKMYVIAWHGIYDSLLFCCKTDVLISLISNVLLLLIHFLVTSLYHIYGSVPPKIFDPIDGFSW